MKVWRLTACLLLAACAPAPAEAPLALPSAPETTAPSASAASPARPPAPPSAGARLAAISLKTRSPSAVKRAEATRSEPSAPLELAAIAELIDAAEPDMFVRYLGGEAVADQEISDRAHFGTYPDPDVSTGALAPYEAYTLLGYAEGYPFLLVLSATSRAPAKGTPALVWSVAGERATLLSLDGVLFECAASEVAPGAGPSASWPAVLDPLTARAPAYSNLRDRFAARADDDALLKCAQRAWSKLKPKDEEQRALLVGAAVRKACSKELAAWEATVAAAVEASVKERAALRERAKARCSGC